MDLDKVASVVTLFGGMKLPANLTPEKLNAMAKLLGIALPSFAPITDVVARVQALQRNNPDLTVKEVFEDQDIQFFFKGLYGQKGVIRCPACGFVEEAPLLNPPPCTRCKTERIRT